MALADFKTKEIRVRKGKEVEEVIVRDLIGLLCYEDP